jgi:hypothetical protein
MPTISVPAVPKKAGAQHPARQHAAALLVADPPWAWVGLGGRRRLVVAVGDRGGQQADDQAEQGQAEDAWASWRATLMLRSLPRGWAGRGRRRGRPQ